MSVKYLKQGVEIDEQGCDQIQESWRFLGMAYLRLEDDKAARKAFRRCKEIDPSSDPGIECAQILEGI